MIGNANPFRSHSRHLEFNVPFQHKYGHIRDERSGVESYPYPVKEGQRYITSTLAEVIQIAYLYTEFDDSGFSRSRDMIGAQKNLNGSSDLTTPLSRLVCYPL